MKTPRVHDFDPDAKLPELNSPLDGMPAIQKPHPMGQHPSVFQEKAPEQPSVRPVPSVHPVRPVLPAPSVKRIMRQRHPFDIYQDQYEALRDLAAEERKQGGVGSMSAMAREALDTFIKAKRRGGK